MTDNELLLAISDMMDKKLEINLKPIRTELTNVETRLTNVETRLTNVENELANVKTGLTRVNLTVENNVLPRLQNIESCYTDTYNRYNKNADRMDAALDDIGLLKKIVIEHSEKLKNAG